MYATRRLDNISGTFGRKILDFWATNIVRMYDIEKYNVTNYSVDVGLWRCNAKESYHAQSHIGVI